MAVNLPPQYHDAEARYKKGRTPEEKLAALREMWVILPKHKASEKVQAILKTMRDSEGKHEDDCWADDARIGAAVFSSADAKEGPRAFAEKRPANFTGS